MPDARSPTMPTTCTACTHWCVRRATLCRASCARCATTGASRRPARSAPFRRNRQSKTSAPARTWVRRRACVNARRAWAACASRCLPALIPIMRTRPLRSAGIVPTIRPAHRDLKPDESSGCSRLREKSSTHSNPKREREHKKVIHGKLQLLLP